MSVLDIIVIVVLALGLLIGLWRGFLRTLLNLFSNVASIVVAVLLAKPVTNVVQGWFGILNTISNGISGVLESNILPKEGYPMDAEAIKSGLQGSSIMNSLVSPFIPADTSQIADAHELSTIIGSKLGQIVLMIIVAIVLFIIIKILVRLLAKLFDAITKKSAISGLDRVLGGVVGLLKGAILVFVVLSVLYALNSLPFINSWFDGLVNDSHITLYIYNAIQDLFTFILSKVDISGAISGLIQ